MNKITVDIDLAKKFLSLEEALDLLAPHKIGRKLRVHSFTSSGFTLMGCDIDLTQVKKQMKNALLLDGTLENIQLSGRNMNRVGHGVAYWTENNGWTFLQTNTEKINAILAKRKITL